MQYRYTVVQQGRQRTSVRCDSPEAFLEGLSACMRMHVEGIEVDEAGMAFTIPVVFSRVTYLLLSEEKFGSIAVLVGDGPELEVRA